mgnify:CR=1 FL=1
MPRRFWKVTAFDAMRFVVDAIPLAVMLVVEAPPFIENKPEVIVDDAFERKPFVNVARPVCKSVPVWVVSPRTESEPSCANCEKRFVEEAVVAKMLVEVALPSDTLPLDVRLAAVKVVPLKVRLAESMNAPAVVIYGTRFAIRDETVRLVVEAVLKYPVPETVS